MSYPTTVSLEDMKKCSYERHLWPSQRGWNQKAEGWPWIPAPASSNKKHFTLDIKSWWGSWTWTTPGSSEQGSSFPAEQCPKPCCNRRLSKIQSLITQDPKCLNLNWKLLIILRTGKLSTWMRKDSQSKMEERLMHLIYNSLDTEAT